MLNDVSDDKDGSVPRRMFVSMVQEDAEEDDAQEPAMATGDEEKKNLETRPPARGLLSRKNDGTWHD